MKSDISYRYLQACSRTIFSFLVIGFSGASVAASVEDVQQQVRSAFLLRYDALSAGVSEPFDAPEDPILRGYLLSPWLQALKLRNAINNNEVGAMDQAQKFLLSAGEAGYARELRRLVVKQLAGRGDWPTLITQYREASANDEMRCVLARARINMKDTAGLAADLAKRWVEADAKFTPACDSAFEWLKTQPQMTTKVLADRIRARLLDNDIANVEPLIPLLPANMREPVQNWIQLLQDPDNTVPALASEPVVNVNYDGLADVFLRYIRKYPDQAQSLLPQIIQAQQLPAAAADKLKANLALTLSWNRDPEAFKLYKGISSSIGLDERNHEWRVRSALWAGDYKTAVKWIQQMPRELASQQRWRYWLGRSMLSSGDVVEGAMQLQALSKEFDTFGLLAAWQLKRGYVPSDRVLTLTAANRKTLAENLSLQRAREAYKAGLNTLALAELRAAQISLPEPLKFAVISEISSWGWYAQAIALASELKIYDEISALYPMPYAEDVKAAAEQAGIPEAWIFSVMRRESAFRPDAASGAGALGLLQLLPSTASTTALKNGLPQPSDADLLVPSINIPLGAFHLAEVYRRYDKNWLFALAAYNAGPNAMRRWLPYRTMDADVWMENIPFNETRNYLQRILMHVAVYQWQATHQPIKPDAWLPPIKPAFP